LGWGPGEAKEGRNFERGREGRSNSSKPRENKENGKEMRFNICIEINIE
jgi:hypothetical protein